MEVLSLVPRPLPSRPTASPPPLGTQDSASSQAQPVSPGPDAWSLVKRSTCCAEPIEHLLWGTGTKGHRDVLRGQRTRYGRSHSRQLPGAVLGRPDGHRVKRWGAALVVNYGVPETRSTRPLSQASSSPSIVVHASPSLYFFLVFWCVCAVMGTG